MYRGKCILKPRAYFGVCTPDFSNMTSIGDITQSPEFMYRGKCILKPRAYFGVCTPDFSNMTSIGDITQSPEENIETRREELYRGIEELFTDHEGKHHLVLRPLIFVNAKDQADPEIEVLKKTLYRTYIRPPMLG
ncbi:Hypothetical predicted protein [Mytilus galloprovincialis]|uniref:Uncharacterized protein n=1 Tax=Mytilus galloprovincialis TaxID=29158 RepID=A0A8B6FB13_MYTGA|nr:Hypothetical predicted protein [Mytilus galloprovincialis]